MRMAANKHKTAMYHRVALPDKAELGWGSDTFDGSSGSGDRPDLKVIMTWRLGGFPGNCIAAAQFGILVVAASSAADFRGSVIQGRSG
jgi:hypothetical protein